MKLLLLFLLNLLIVNSLQNVNSIPNQNQNPIQQIDNNKMKHIEDSSLCTNEINNNTEKNYDLILNSKKDICKKEQHDIEKKVNNSINEFNDKILNENFINEFNDKILIVIAFILMILFKLSIDPNNNNYY